MLRIDPDVICHKLSIKMDAKQLKQKPRRMNEEQNYDINDEVDHPRWLHLRDVLPRMALQSCSRKEKMASGESALTSPTTIKLA